MAKPDRDHVNLVADSRSFRQFIEWKRENEALVSSIILIMMESLILAQDERWRRGLGMQVER